MLPFLGLVRDRLSNDDCCVPRKLALSKYDHVQCRLYETCAIKDGRQKIDAKYEKGEKRE